MRGSRGPGTKHYRLVMDDRDPVTVRVFEFDADGPQGALFVAQRLGQGRDVAVFEDGRPLARVRATEGAGYWVINPPQLHRPA